MTHSGQIVSALIASSVVGLLIGKQKNRPLAGFYLGLLLGPLGWMVVGVCSKRSIPNAARGPTWISILKHTCFVTVTIVIAALSARVFQDWVQTRRVLTGIVGGYITETDVAPITFASNTVYYRSLPIGAYSYSRRQKCILLSADLPHLGSYTNAPCVVVPHSLDSSTYIHVDAVPWGAGARFVNPARQVSLRSVGLNHEQAVADSTKRVLQRIVTVDQRANRVAENLAVIDDYISHFSSAVERGCPALTGRDAIERPALVCQLEDDTGLGHGYGILQMAGLSFEVSEPLPGPDIDALRKSAQRPDLLWSKTYWRNRFCTVIYDRLKDTRMRRPDYRFLLPSGIGAKSVSTIRLADVKTVLLWRVRKEQVGYYATGGAPRGSAYRLNLDCNVYSATNGQRIAAVAFSREPPSEIALPGLSEAGPEIREMFKDVRREFIQHVCTGDEEMIDYGSITVTE